MPLLRLRPAALAPLLLALAGCAATTIPPLQVPNLDRSQNLATVDARPAAETEYKVFSHLITDDEYGIVRTGEFAMQPSPVRLLQHRAFERVGPNAQIRIHHFVTYRNSQAQFRAGAAGAALAGALGGLITSQAARSDVPTAVTSANRSEFERWREKDEWRRGTFTEAENPKKGAVLITYLDAEMNGRREFVRVMSAMQGPEGEIPYVKAVEAAIGGWLQRVSDPARAAAPTVASPGVAALPARAEAPAAAGPRSFGERLVEGHTWVFDHPRDPAQFGQVRLVMSHGQLQASNSRGRTTGAYTVQGEQLCASFQSPQWPAVCYEVQETVEPGGSVRRELVFVRSGRKVPLTIE